MFQLELAKVAAVEREKNFELAKLSFEREKRSSKLAIIHYNVSTKLILTFPVV